MFYSGLLTEGGRKETDMREAASLRQQRRMKQAVQFIHKDSADLLPLDGLKKLGSSKDTVSPRVRARLGSPARGRRLRAVRCPGARPSPLSLSHRPGRRCPLSRYCSPSIPCFGVRVSGLRRSGSSSPPPLDSASSLRVCSAAKTLPCLLAPGSPSLRIMHYSQYGF